MSPKQFKDTRVKLALTQAELAQVLGLSGKMTISHFETGFRTPSPLIGAIMSYLGCLTERKASTFIEEFSRHIEQETKSSRRRKNG